MSILLPLSYYTLSHVPSSFIQNPRTSFSGNSLFASESAFFKSESVVPAPQSSCAVNMNKEGEWSFKESASVGKVSFFKDAPPAMDTRSKSPNETPRDESRFSIVFWMRKSMQWTAHMVHVWGIIERYYTPVFKVVEEESEYGTISRWRS